LTSTLSKKLEARAEKREAILAAARQVFSTNGVVDVTMEDIAKAAGVGKGSLYLHFASKDELYLHLSAQGGKLLLECIQRAVQQPTGFLAFKAAAHAYAEFCLEDPIRFRLDSAWLETDYRVDYRLPMAQEYRDVITGIMRLCVETFVKGQHDGTIRASLAAATTTYQIWGAVLGLIVLHGKAAVVASTPQVDPNEWSQTVQVAPSSIDLERFVPDFIDQMMTLVENRDAK
jgi:AcrR family transcriptional regulator